MARKRHINKIITPILFTVLELLSICIIVFENEIVKLRFFTGIVQAEASVLAVVENAKYYLSLKKTNENLVNENIELKEEILALTAEIEEYKAQGHALADTTISGAYDIIPGKILRNSTTQRINYVIINKGRRHGVRPEMGVITQNGVLGIVTSASENVCSVLSLLSKNTSISARIDRTGTIGPMVWEGKSTKYMSMPEIPHHIEVNTGDTVSTSGYSSVFPPNIPLGIVENVEMTKTGFKKAEIRLFEEYSSIHFVSIVNSRDTEEIRNELKKQRTE